MKVKPIIEADSAQGWFEPDDELNVLAINNSIHDGSRYLLWSEIQKAVALFPAKEFEIVEGTIPSLWRVELDLNGFVELAPQEWQTVDFWDRYNEDDPDAVQVFQELAAQLA